MQNLTITPIKKTHYYGISKRAKKRARDYIYMYIHYSYILAITTAHDPIVAFHVSHAISAQNTSILSFIKQKTI